MNAREAVQRTYDIIVDRHAVQMIDLTTNPAGELGGGALSIIADDSDHHRQRRGLMIYPSIAICNFGTEDTLFHPWAIAHGEKGGSYPGDEYATDLMAFRYEPPRRPVSEYLQTQELLEFTKFVGDVNDHFRASFLTVMRDGRLIIRKAALGAKITPLCEPYILARSKRMAMTPSQLQVYLGEAYTFRRDFPKHLATWIAEYFSPAPPMAARPRNTARSI